MPPDGRLHRCGSQYGVSPLHSPSHCANTLHQAADVAIQFNGARGYSRDTIAEWVYRAARAARLVDGADEVHKMVLAKFMREEGRDFWSWSAGNKVLRVCRARYRARAATPGPRRCAASA